VAADAEHPLTHAVRRLVSATVHTDPDSHPGAHHHAALSHGRRAGDPATTDGPEAAADPRLAGDREAANPKAMGGRSGQSPHG
jgi:hypothetical protein